MYPCTESLKHYSAQVSQPVSVLFVIALIAFQQFINDIFSNLLDVYVMIYLDNILIYSNNMSKYYQHVKEVLKCLHKASHYAKAEKCEFHSELVEYLGYILSPSGLTMSDDKVKII